MRHRILTAALVGAIALGTASAAIAGPERIAFPEDYAKTFALYEKVDRADRKIVRFMYVNAEARSAARSGIDLPDGTILIMEDHKVRLDADGAPVKDANGRFVPTDEVTNVFVMEKRAGWGAAYPADFRNGDWEYAWFLPDGSRKADAKFEGCFNCHRDQAGEDYNFTFSKSLSAAR